MSQLQRLSPSLPSLLDTPAPHQPAFRAWQLAAAVGTMIGTANMAIGNRETWMVPDATMAILTATGLDLLLTMEPNFLKGL